MRRYILAVVLAAVLPCLCPAQQRPLQSKPRPTSGTRRRSVSGPHWLRGYRPALYYSFNDEQKLGRDDSGNGHDLTIPGKAKPVDGVCGGAVQFTGFDRAPNMGRSPQGPHTSTAKLRYPSEKGFSVGYYVRMGSTTGGVGVRDYWQHRAGGESFGLRYNAGARKADFFVRHDFGQPISVEAEVSGKPGQWVHLLGVYDPKGPGILLYIDGRLAGKAAMPARMRASKPPYLYVSGSWHGTEQSAIDEVVLYDQAVRPIHGSAPRWLQGYHPALYYSFDDEQRLGRDDSGNGHDLTIPGKAKPVDGVCGGAVQFTGFDRAPNMGQSPQGPHTSTAKLRYPSENGFSVGYYVRMGSTTGGVGVRDYWQHGAGGESFGLRYNAGTGKADFFVRHDFNQPVSVEADVSGKPGQWVHLLGVYDPQGPRILLYVDGRMVGRAAMPARMRASKPPYLYVSGSWHGTEQSAIDEVVLYDQAVRPITPLPSFLILPVRQDLASFLKGRPTHFMPETQADVLAGSPGFSLGTVVPLLSQQTIWPEQRRRILLVGVGKARGRQLAPRHGWIGFPSPRRLPPSALSGDALAGEDETPAPAAAAVVEKLKRGQAAVWLLIECGNQQTDGAALGRLRGALQKAQAKHRASFSVVRVAAGDPREKALVLRLLATEPDLTQYKNKPMAFIAWGPAYVLPQAMVGLGINDDNVAEMCAFAVQNPTAAKLKRTGLDAGFQLLGLPRAANGGGGKEPLPLASLPPGKVVLGYNLWKSLAIGGGQIISVTGRDFEVVRCLAANDTIGDDCAYMSLRDAQDLTLCKGRITGIWALRCMSTRDNVQGLAERIADAMGGAVRATMIEPLSAQTIE